MLNLKVLFLIITTLFLGGIYIWNAQGIEYFGGLLLPHGEIGYNFARSNSIKLNPERMSRIASLQTQKKRIVDYAEIDHSQFGPPTVYRSINDTIGYGVLLGLLWKMTGSFKYIDVQILQLFMYLFMLFFIYQIVLMFFANRWFAYFACFIHLSFLPLLAQNAYVLRDIWAYYATVALIYSIACIFYKKNHSALMLIGSGVFFALCAHLRPTLFSTLLVVLGVAGLYGICTNRRFLTIKLVSIFLITQVLFFWIPFIAYNKVAYNRWFVSPSGQWLLEGVGTFPNQWGYQLSDQWYADFMKERYGLKHGTPECEDKGRELYWAAVRENPGFFIKALVKQIPDMVFPDLPWCAEIKIPEVYDTQCKTASEKLQRFLKYPSFGVLANFFLLKWFRYVFMIICYFGMICMIYDKQWFAFLLLGSVILSGYHFIFSHVEARYVIPFYWPCTIFVSYSIVRIGSFFSKKIRLSSEVPVVGM